MALSKDDILNAIAEMSVMEVVELIEAMEEKFGVTAAAAVAAAPAAAAEGGAAAADNEDDDQADNPCAHRDIEQMPGGQQDRCAGHIAVQFRKRDD